MLGLDAAEAAAGLPPTDPRAARHPAVPLWRKSWPSSGTLIYLLLVAIAISVLAWIVRAPPEYRWTQW